MQPRLAPLLGSNLGPQSLYGNLGETGLGFHAFLTDNGYFESIAAPGLWEVWFLLGSLVAGALYAALTKSFGLRLVHERWREYRGESPRGRLLWAFVGGFALLFGARMAGGCTSGHILSGGMQLAKSGMVFAAFAFIAFLLTGKLFYKARREPHGFAPRSTTLLDQVD